MPAEETCLSLFAAPSAAAVADVNVRAGFDFTRIIDAVAFPATPAERSHQATPVTACPSATVPAGPTVGTDAERGQ
jgi:hypothetical protein